MIEEEYLVKKDDWLIANNEVLRYLGNDKIVVVPDGIVKIKMEAFKLKTINKLILPSSLKMVEMYAFCYCALPEIYFPDNIEFIDRQAFFKTNVKKISFNFNTFFEGIDTSVDYEIRGNNLFQILNSDFYSNNYPLSTNYRKESKFISAVILEEPTYNELKKQFDDFINSQRYYCSNKILSVISVIKKGIEKSKYVLKPDGYLAILGNDFSDVDLKSFLVSKSGLCVDNTSGNNFEDLINYIEENIEESKEISNEILTLYFIGDGPTFNQKFRLKELFFRLGICRHLNFNRLDDFLLKLNTDENQMHLTFGVFDEEIDIMIKEIQAIIGNLNDQDRDFVLNLIKEKLDKYQADLENNKPKLEFNQELTFGKENKNASDLKAELLSNLNEIKIKLEMGNYYKELQDRIEDYEKYLEKVVTILPTEIKSVSDKIAFIKFVDEKYKKGNYLKCLKKIFENVKEEISKCLVKGLKDVILENSDDLNLVFNQKIDDLYKQAEKVYNLLELFFNIENSKLAMDILTIREIISKFDKVHKDEYNKKIDDFINEQLHFMIRQDDSLEKIELNFRKNWTPLLEELKNVTPIYVNYGSILNALNENDKDFAISVKAVYDEAKKFILESSMTDDDKENAILEFNKVVEKWKQRIFSGETEIENEAEDPFALEKIPITDDNLVLQLKIIKDILDVKNSVERYLEEKKNYEEIASKTIFFK